MSTSCLPRRNPYPWALFILVLLLFAAPEVRSQTNCQYLLNLNFGSGVRVGTAATGNWTNDVWNIVPAATNVVSTYTYFLGSPTVTTVAYTTATNLLWADGSNSTVTATVTNFFSTNSSPYFYYYADAMLNSYLSAPYYLVYDFAEELGTTVITADPKILLRNLPTNTYDIYIYALGEYSSEVGSFRLKVGANAWSDWQATYDTYEWSYRPTNWVEGLQYVKFTNVVVGASEDVLVDVGPDYSGIAFMISGMQIIQSGGKPVGPDINPVSGTFTTGISITITNDPADFTIQYKINNSGWGEYSTSFNLYTDATVYAKVLYPRGVESFVVYETYSFPDGDADGLTDAYENYIGTSVLLVDTDYDGRSDWEEVQEGTNPLSASSALSVQLAHFPFSTTNWLGESGQVPLVKVAISNVNSWEGKALQINTNIAANLRYRVLETNGFANINLQRGSVRLWFRPQWASTNVGGTGPGVWSRLLEVGAYTNDATYGQWVIGLNEEGSEMLFSIQAGGNETNLITAPVSFNSNVWHQIVITYTASNSVAYFDGVEIGDGPGVPYYPGAAVRAAEGLNVGGTSAGGDLAKGIVDELEIYNFPLSAADIWSYYEFQRGGDKDADGVADVDEDEQGTNPTVSNLPLSIIITQPRPGSIIP